MTIERSKLQVHDLSELETLGVLDTAIQNASARRQDSEIAVSEAEANGVHGGLIRSPYVAGYFPVVLGYLIAGPYGGLDPINPALDKPQIF